MNISYLLYLMIILGLMARSRVVVIAAFSLLIIKELGMISVSEFLSRNGIELGLIFMLMAILAPLILKPLSWNELKDIFLNWKVLIAILSGLLATQFNGMGLTLLEGSPHLIIGIIVGSLLGIVLLGGIPVGPLMAAGIAALLFELIELLFKV
ncbi:MAG: DUF441 domain-containing protein [Halanaerobiaceae bacterium]